MRFRFIEDRRADSAGPRARQAERQSDGSATASDDLREAPKG
jgi:hypothetical protein